MTNVQAIPLPSRLRSWETDSWEEKRERLDACWEAMFDEKRRLVHGHAIIVETPAHMLGRVLEQGGTRLQIGTKPFSVTIVATRDGCGFGAMARSTWHATRELALEYARAALVEQGKRYARKYGAS